MAGNLRESITKISANSAYKKAFKHAFGSDTITSSAITRALAQYQRSLISANSRYDQWQTGKASLNQVELNGWHLFESYCANCHHPPLFTNFEYYNIGLDSLYPSEKEGILQGRYRITYDSSDLGAFKTPSLRNLAFTPPYMHDGRYASLEEVIDHFSGNLIAGPYLSKSLPKEGYSLSNEEKKALLAFLHTLNDSSFVELNQSR
jgi:cytochrome c peroxidase